MNNSKTLRSVLYAAGNSTAAFVIGLVITFSLLVIDAYGQTPKTRQEPTEIGPEKAEQAIVSAKSVVRGRAVYDDTNRPVRRARVFLFGLNSKGPEQLGRTNGSGEFQIKNVTAGSYYVMIDASGIITPLSYMDLEDAGSGKFDDSEIKTQFDEVVVDGIHDVTVKVRARRGGAISGNVTYGDGDPAINVRVNFMRKKDGRLSRVITNLNPSALFGTQTDDRGMYRVSGLPPGEYVVSAAETIDHNGNGGGQPGDFMGMYGSDSLVVTYYKGTARASDASVIQIDLGQEQKEVNITLVDRVLHSISGTVTTKHVGAPLKNARISIKSKDNVGSSPLFVTPTSLVTDEQGVFSFTDMADGVYTLTIDPPYVGEVPDIDDDGELQPSSTTSTGKPIKSLTRKQQEVTVSGSDVTDVTIVLTEGATVSGTVTVEGNRPLPQLSRVTLQPLSGREAAASTS